MSFSVGRLVTFIALPFVFVSFGFAAPYPQGPELSITPGSTCDKPSAHRYPEKVAYCNRNVDKELKYKVIDRYEKEFGYGVMEYGRENFKIDHLIPLCAGGSNEENNLWPQHRTIYEKTDLLEQRLCEKMAAGKLRQARAINLILEAKTDLNKVSGILQEIEAM